MTITEELTTPVIITQKRWDDWIACCAANPNQYETGRTEAEAIGRLHISYPETFGVIQRQDWQSDCVQKCDFPVC